MDFFLFLLLNFTLFVRPAEIFPDLEGLPIYNVLILATFAAVILRLPEHLNPDQLHREPITFCVLGLLFAVPWSHMAHFDLYSARVQGIEFSKTVMYYLVLITTLNTTKRLKIFLYSVALYTTTIAVLALLHYFEYVDLPSLSAVEEGGYDEFGERFAILRLRATGLFNDPNDFSMIVVAGLMVSLYGLFDRKVGFRRFLWILPAAILLWALGLTKSRGGALALCAAVGLISYFRFGVWKTAVVLSICLPAATLLIGGRSTEFEGGTGEERAELWAEGLQMWKTAPLFGIGQGMYAEEVGQVAHNSFVHAFTELGLFGGALFLGAFWFAGLSLWKIVRKEQACPSPNADPMLRRLQLYMLVLVVGCAVSFMSISRCYVQPTYFILGMANCVCLESRRQGLPTVELTPRRLAQLLPVSIGFIVAIHLFIKISIR